MDAMTFLRDRVALFAGVADAELELLAMSSTLSTHAAGTTILFKGATVDGLHVVCSGTATVWSKAPNKTAVKVAELASGDVFGETSIVEMGTAGATIKAAEETLVLMIPQEAFRHLLQRDEAFAVRVNTLIRSRKTASSVPA